MKSKVHPSRWKIRHTSNTKFCQTLALPLGPNEPQYIVSTKFMNKVYTASKVSSRTNNAGDFAEALREIMRKNVTLWNIPQVNKPMIDTAFGWLEKYEQKVNQFRVEAKEEHKELIQTSKKLVEAAKGPTEKPTDPAYDQLLRDLILSYAGHIGPLADPKLVVAQAKAVADAYRGLSSEA